MDNSSDQKNTSRTLKNNAPSGNRTRGSTMGMSNFTTKLMVQDPSSKLSCTKEIFNIMIESASNATVYIVHQKPKVKYLVLVDVQGE